jgi:hypothetical protein
MLCELHVGEHLIWVSHDAEKMRHERAAFIRLIANSEEDVKSPPSALKTRLAAHFI